LRTGEVATVGFDDIDRDSGEILLRDKANRHDSLLPVRCRVCWFGRLTSTTRTPSLHRSAGA
jgi:hypothetical protein